jgi:putative chitinase
MIPRTSHLVAAGVKQAVAEKWIEAVRDACREFGIDTPQRIAGFLSQCAHESGGFTMLQENLNYRAATMATVWPTRFAEREPDPKSAGKTRAKKDAKGANIPNKFALALERKPEAIANVVYANRMGNGPTESGEGWLYRGRGLKQLTGKDNHRACSKGLGVDLVENPDLLLEPAYAARSAAWFWATNNCSRFADAGDLEGLTKKINGGLIGFADRKSRYDKALSAINSSTETSALA